MSDLSIATYTASGAASAQYAVPFPFIGRSHVRVLTAYDKGAGTFDAELAAGSGFLWINDSTIEIPALTGGTVFSIVRQTPSDLPLVDWVAGGGALTANELTTSTLQALYLAQERFDQAAATSAQAGSAEGVSAIAIADAAAAVVTAQEALAVAESAAEAAIDGVIPDGSISAAKLATGAVTESRIADGAVTAAKASAEVQASLSKADSAVQPAGLAPYAPQAGFRNAIINGGFDVWQRGTEFTAISHGDFFSDHWRASLDGTGGSSTISRQAFTVGQTDVPGEPTYYLRWEQTIASSGQTYQDLRQAIEDVRTFAGQQVTLSFYAKAASATVLPLVQLIQGFGSGGSDYVGFWLAPNVALSTSWQKFAYTITLPSISGKTLGDGHYLAVLFRTPINSTFTFDIAQVQLEPGPVATPFERRPIGVELALCQRYFYKCSGNQGGGIGAKSAANVNTVAFNSAIQFPVTMRTAPTHNWDSPIYSNCTDTDNSSDGQEFRSRVSVTAPGDYRKFGGTLTFDAEL